MARKNAYEIRKRNKSARIKQREERNKRSDRMPQDKRDLFARKMMNVIEHMQQSSQV